MPHIVLLGDSVFDNAAYVPHHQAVIEKLTNKLPEGWQATLVARDGAVTSGVLSQLQHIPSDATHVIVSAGGNDALRYSAILQQSSRSIADSLSRLADVQDEFRLTYREMLDQVQARRRPTAICTIYDARFPDPEERRIASTALSVLNDVITREAAVRGLPVLDLRVLFNEDTDFANPIEPSAAGGEKLARSVLRLVRSHDFSAGHAVLVGKP